MSCSECYSKDSRVTPVLKAQECLERHVQYICGTCGRAICIQCDRVRGVYRWNFPFKSLEIAKLYLRAAEVSCESACGIYELVGKNNRLAYKIFKSHQELEAYLVKNKAKTCPAMKPVYVSECYKASTTAVIKQMTPHEVICYLTEQLMKEK